MRKIIFILVVCLVALSSCQWDGKSGNTADVDVRVARYDRLQYEYVTMNSFSALQKMNTDYPQVTKLLIEDVLAIGEVDDMKINDGRIWYPSEGALKGAILSKDNFNVPRGELTDSDWDYMRDWLRPVLLSFIKCNKVLLEGATFKNSPSWCLHPLSCENITINKVTVSNPWSGSPQNI